MEWPLENAAFRREMTISEPAVAPPRQAGTETMSSRLENPTLSPVAVDGDPWLRRPLEAPALLAWRCAAVGFALLELFVYFRWVPRWMDSLLSQALTAQMEAGSSLPYVGPVWAAGVIAMVCVSSWCAMALIILWKRSRDRFGILLFLGFVSVGVVNSTDFTSLVRHHSADSAAPVAFMAMLSASALSIMWFFVFPDGRFVPRWAAWVAGAWIGWNVLRFSLYLAGALPHWLLTQIIVIAFVVTSMCTLVARYLTGSSEVQRNQLKWLLLCGLVALMTYLAFYLVKIANLDSEAPGFLFGVASQAMHATVTAAGAVAMFIAIFRQGLLDVDRWISRTLFYSALTAVVLTAFFIVSAVASRLLKDVAGQTSDLVLALLALPMAIAFLIVRSRLSRLLDTLLSERRILSVMFIDIVNSTVLAVEMGDEAWSDKLERFRTVVRRALDNFGGIEIDTAGDGFFATFAGPAGAIRCAESIIDEVQQLGIAVRAGVHTGEVTRRGDRAVGVAVHVGARIMALAAPSELLVSGVVRDLVAGSRIDLVERGEHPLKGLPGTFRLYGLAH
ncbi:adenylate/guanylate cyclase domain-containing protein [Variovorax sp. J22R24]|uniref:adenylate/guanylate cyclase domain-containing protein n=1 Tax=Variovorax gracilis TaxID=3053502 RepID=UPI0025767246|nr:adenylate/guanylate cyclase domain-containing protein [Variovorax sp. J22R24]MDM0109881.1 adenylate/guanylate cyclase domain-containing protein [Variovorax sp. J22R24]